MNIPLSYLTILGIGVFFLLYIWAASVYPGGNSVDEQASGFSWFHNYWCDLLGSQATNGEKNPAQSIALGAMVILCLAISIFWWTVPNLFVKHSSLVLWVRLLGITGMFIGLFLFTDWHDRVIDLGGGLAAIALGLCFVGFYEAGLRAFFFSGLTCLLLCLVNYIMYQFHFLWWLPLVQKLSFVVVLAWVCWISLAIK